MKKEKEQEEKLIEERRLKTEEIFRGLAAANQIQKEKGQPKAANFELIMQE